MMRVPVATAAGRTPFKRPWRRRQPRQAWARQDSRAPVSIMLAAIPSLPRAELARLTMRMIDCMDDIDGDPDLENLRDDDEDGQDHEREQAYE
jgi:hypothetical protein